MWYWFYKWSEDFSRNLEPSWYLSCSLLILVDAGSFVWMDFPTIFFKWVNAFVRFLQSSFQIHSGHIGYDDMVFYSTGIIHCCWTKWRGWLGANGHEAVQHSMFKQTSGSNLCHINTPYTIYGTTPNLHNTLLTTEIHDHMQSALLPSSAIRPKQMETWFIRACHTPSPSEVN